MLNYKEVTIQFTDKCNMLCKYCFAPKNTNQSLSERDFEIFKKFCCDNYVDCIHITGGEPALHSCFSKFVNQLAKIADLVIYTNGTIPDMAAKITSNNSKSISMLVNINNRDDYSDFQWETLNNNIKTAIRNGINIAVGHTFTNSFYKNEINYILSLIEKYSIKLFRVSQSLQSFDGVDGLTIQQIGNLYDYVSEHIDEWGNKGIKVYFDCPVPACYIKDKTFEKLRSYNAVGTYCIPKVFVMANLCVTHCYTTMDMPNKPILQEFSNIKDARKYTESVLKEMSIKNNDVGCYQCEHYKENISCGCPIYGK